MHLEVLSQPRGITNNYCRSFPSLSNCETRQCLSDRVVHAAIGREDTYFMDEDTGRCRVTWGSLRGSGIVTTRRRVQRRDSSNDIRRSAALIGCTSRNPARVPQESEALATI